MIGSDAKDRLMNLLENNPELFSKAMKKHIAGFLALTRAPSADCFPPRSKSAPANNGIDNHTRDGHSEDCGDMAYRAVDLSL